MLAISLNKNTLHSIVLLSGLTMLFVFTAKDANAGLEEDFRQLLLKQVSQDVSDKAFVSDIVEIRFRREFEKWRVNYLKTQESTFTPNKTTVLNDDALKHLSNKNFGSSNAVYGGVGNRVFAGISTHISHNFKSRTDLSVFTSGDKVQTLHGSPYVVEKKNYSLGSYIDWYPFEKNFRFSAGININKMQHKVASQSDAVITVNGKFAQAGSNYLNITYKFPKVTPFLGIGYETGTGNDYGWNGVAEVGVMIGRYNAEAKTNLLGENSINLQDLSAEIDANRNAMFKSQYQPIAKIGLKYGY